MKKNPIFFICALTCSLFIASTAHADMCTQPRDDKGTRQLVNDLVVPELCTIDSKIDKLLTDGGEAEKLWSIESKAEVISSKIDIIAYDNDVTCAPTPITTGGPINGKTTIAITSPATLTKPGAYCLAQDINATETDTGITISSSNITLDLNGYTISGGDYGLTITGNAVTVRNGTISGSTAAGIMLLNNNNCRIEHVDVIDTPTGFLFNNTRSNKVSDCRAIRCHSAGFYLNESSNNVIIGCQALDLNGPKNVIGFFAQKGQLNLFQSCRVSDAYTETQDATNSVAGFYLEETEANTNITDCQAVKIQAPGETRAVGILANGHAVQDINIQGTPATVVSVDWSPDGTYFAYGDINGQVAVFSFDGNALHKIQTINGIGPIYRIAWNPSATEPYQLALLYPETAEGSSSTLITYTFDGTTLTLDQQTTISGATTFGWSPDGAYLATNLDGSSFQTYDIKSLAVIETMVREGGTTIHTLSWRQKTSEEGEGYVIAIGAGEGDSGVLAAYGLEVGASKIVLQYGPVGYPSPTSVQWSPTGMYLLAGAASGSFTIHTQDLTELSSGTSPSTFPISQVSWSYNDSQFAISYAGSNETGSYGAAVYYSFGGATITRLGAHDHQAPVNTISWPRSGAFTTQFALGGATSPSGYEITIFDTFSETSVNYANSATINSVNWSPDGQYFALVDTKKTLKIYSFNGTVLGDPIISQDLGATAYKIAWRPGATGTYYIALVTDTTDNNVVIYTFDGTTLSPFAQAAISGATTLAWSPDGTYLALNKDGSHIATYANDLSLIEDHDPVPTLGSIHALSWRTDGSGYVIAAGTDTRLATFTLNSGGSSIAVQYSLEVPVSTVAWSPNGQYLALSAGYTLVIFPQEFHTPEDIIASAEDASGDLTTIAWSADGQKIAAGESENENSKTYIYEFTGTALNLQTTKDHGAVIYSVDLPHSGSYTDYLAVGGALNTSGYVGHIYDLTIVQAHHTIKHNLTNDIRTGSKLGIGIKADSTINFVASNISCNNDTNYDSIDSAFITSQANARGVANIDCNLTIEDQVAWIVTYLQSH